REGHAGRGGGLRQSQFAEIPAEPRRAGRRDRYRHAAWLAEQVDAQVPIGEIDHEPRAHFQSLESGAVLGKRDFVLRSAIDELEDATRQARPSRAAEVED